MKIREGEDYYFAQENPSADNKQCLMKGTLYKCEKPGCENFAYVNGAWLTNENHLSVLQQAQAQANAIGKVHGELCMNDNEEHFCETCYYKKD